MTGFLADAAMVCGWVGVACSLSAYWCVSTGRMAGESLRYQALNITACFCLAVACFATASWPSMVANVLFILIGLRMTWNVRDRLILRLRSIPAFVKSLVERRYVTAA